MVGRTLVVTNASGCSASNTVNVTINANPAAPPILIAPQTFTVTGASGTFTLTFNGQTTGPLGFNATAAQVQTALQGLSTIGAGNVTVAQFGNLYTVTFVGALAGPQPSLTGT